MFRTVLHSKIHRASVTEAEIHYEGSLTLDSELIAAAHLQVYEKILVVNITNGQRFETYVIEGKKGSGTVCLNGAAARLGIKGDKVIIMSFAQIPPEKMAEYQPKIVKVDENNRILP